MNKEFDKAAIVAKELETEQYVQYRQLLSEVRSNNNIELGYKLLEIIPALRNINQKSNLGLVYSSIIDSYGKYLKFNGYIYLYINQLSIKCCIY